MAVEAAQYGGMLLHFTDAAHPEGPWARYNSAVLYPLPLWLSLSLPLSSLSLSPLPPFPPLWLLEIPFRLSWAHCYLCSFYHLYLKSYCWKCENPWRRWAILNCVSVPSSPSSPVLSLSSLAPLLTDYYSLDWSVDTQHRLPIMVALARQAANR